MFKQKPHLLTWFLAALSVVAILIFSFALRWLSVPAPEQTKYGITFSTLYAQQLGLDYKEAYKALVEEMGVRSVRIPVYWSEVEKEQGVFTWEDYDWLVKYSQSKDVALTLAVGVKVPRWPECFVPDWAEKATDDNQHKYALDMIKETVNRFKGYGAIERWQVENEPFFPFGKCRQITLDEFNQRVELVRSLDDRPIQATVSGEVGPWKDVAKSSDILGISLYRQTWNDAFGYFVYPITPEYYYIRSRFVQDEVDRVIVSELQAEPWFPEAIENKPLTEWYEAFDAQMFQNNLEFVKQARLPEAYLWGAEWWYLLKQNGESRLWNTAKSVF